MAMIQCPECGKAVSDRAESCPNCGYGISKHFINIYLGEKKRQWQEKKKHITDRLKQPKIIGAIVTIMLLVGIMGTISIVSNNRKRSGYFDDVTWNMGSHDIYEKYQEYNIDNTYYGDGRSMLGVMISDYSYYGLTGNATIFFHIDKNQLQSIDVYFSKCDGATEKIKEIFDRYFENTTEESAYYSYLSEYSEITLGETSDDSVYVEYRRRE